MNGLEKIDFVFAVIAIDKDGTQGIPAINGEDGGALPLVSTRPEFVQQLIWVAEQISKKEGLKVVVAKFSNREDLKEFIP